MCLNDKLVKASRVIEVVISHTKHDLHCTISKHTGSETMREIIAAAYTVEVRSGTAALGEFLEETSEL